MHKLFGTDGVRGTANIDPITAEMALQIAEPRPISAKIKNIGTR